MKVTDTQQGQLPGPASGKGTRRSEEGGFQKVMEQVSQQERPGGTGVQRAAGAPVPDGVQIIPGLEKTNEVGTGGAREMVLAEIRETLDMIDHYAADLGNTDLSPAAMKPLVDHLEGRMEGLRAMEQDTELPEAVRSVVSDLVITIGTEVAKFGRGDYE
jgi:hypothetical protein